MLYVFLSVIDSYLSVSFTDDTIIYRYFKTIFIVFSFEKNLVKFRERNLIFVKCSVG